MQQHRIWLSLETIQIEFIQREMKMFYHHSFDIQSLFHAKFFPTCIDNKHRLAQHWQNQLSQHHRD